MVTMQRASLSRQAPYAVRSRHAALAYATNPSRAYRTMTCASSLQRVARAEVRVGARVTGRIDRGFLLLVGFTHGDDEEQLVVDGRQGRWARGFADAEDKMNLSLADVGGGLLVCRSSRSTATRRKDVVRVHRRGPAGMAIPFTSGLSRCCASAASRSDGRVRRDDGCRARERWAGDAVARAMTARASSSRRVAAAARAADAGRHSRTRSARRTSTSRISPARSR